MRYYRVGDRFLATDGSATWELSKADPSVRTFEELAKAAVLGDRHLDDLAEQYCTEHSRLASQAPPEDPSLPLVPDEVWAAGVTYRISEEAREAESSLPDVYRRVYDADRPELFLKATPSRTVGPNEPVGIRGDSTWDVPEPELGIVLCRDRIVGYTIGNDMSSRSIEGANPLYLPQAKIYERSCSLGPCVASTRTVSSPRSLELRMAIDREGTTVYEEATSTAELVRTPEELVSYLTRHNTPPDQSVLLTGTGLVPPDEMTLQAGDLVRIELEEVGTLVNQVIEV